MTCACIHKHDVGPEGSMVDSESIHTPHGCYHASLFSDLWLARVERDSLREEVRALHRVLVAVIRGDR